MNALVAANAEIDRMLRRVDYEFRAFFRDRKNKQLYGPDAPRCSERLWVETAAVKQRIATIIPRRCSGQVSAVDWTPETLDVTSAEKIMYCQRHWRDGLSWQDSGAFEFYETAFAKGNRVDDCSNLVDVRLRLEALDRVFETTSRESRLRTVQEMGTQWFREFGGIYMHIDDSGYPIFGNCGFHRMAIAMCADIVVIPVQIGVVHPAAIPSLARLRKEDGGQ